MGTQAPSKPVPIQDFVAELRKFPEPAFSRIDQIIRFLEDTPVASDTLLPYLTWDRQHSGRPVRYTITASRIAGWQSLLADYG